MTYYSLMQYILRQHVDVTVIEDPSKGPHFQTKRKNPEMAPHQPDSNSSSELEIFNRNTLSLFASSLDQVSFREDYILNIDIELKKILVTHPNLKERELHSILYSNSDSRDAIDTACKTFEKIISAADTDIHENFYFNFSCYFTADEFKTHMIKCKDKISCNIKDIHDLGLILNHIRPEYFQIFLDSLEIKIFEKPITQNNFYLLADNATDEAFSYISMQIKNNAQTLSPGNKTKKYIDLFISAPNLTFIASRLRKSKIIIFYDFFETELYNTFGNRFYEVFMANLWHENFKDHSLWNIPDAIIALAPRVTASINNIIYQKLPASFYDFKLKGTKTSRLDAGKIETHYNNLFASELRWGDLNAKKHKTRVVLSEIMTILSDPEFCVELLRKFDDILQAEWENEFPDMPINKLNSIPIKKKLESVSWKIPVEKPQFKKNSFLQRHCIGFMKVRGFANDGIKMMGFVDNGGFEKAVRAGDFFTEPAFNPYFLLHGKTIHNIGRIIMILAYEENLLSYPEDVGIDDVFSALVDPGFANPITKKLPWLDMLDIGAPSHITFSDPHLMHASLMSACDESLPYLSALTTHSFGKKIYDLTEYFNWATKKSWSAEQVWDCYIAPRVPYAIQSTLASDGSNIPQEITHYLEYAKQHKNHTNKPALLMYTHRLYEPAPTTVKAVGQLSNT